MSDEEKKSCCTCEEVKKIIHEEVNKVFDSKVEELKGMVKTKKRTLSKWQIFLKECIPTKQTLPFKERIKACSVEWKKKKAS